MERETGTAAGLAKRILSVSRNDGVLSTRNAVLRSASFSVASTTSDEEAIGLVRSMPIDGVVLGDSIPWNERHALIRAIRKINPDVFILTLKLDNEPALPDSECIGSLDGPEKLIAMLRNGIASRRSEP